MRYFDIDDLAFNNADGVNTTVKDIRPINNYENLTTINVENQSFIDNIISSSDFYGNDNEDLSYAVLDHNIVKLTENNFDLSKLKELKIPLIEEV